MTYKKIARLASLGDLFFCGEGGGTHVSIVSNGADYVLDFCRSPPAYYGNHDMVWISILVHPRADAYKSIQSCWITPHTPRRCRRIGVTVSPIKPDFHLQFTLQGDYS